MKNKKDNVSRSLVCSYYKFFVNQIIKNRGPLHRRRVFHLHGPRSWCKSRSHLGVSAVSGPKTGVTTRHWNLLGKSTTSDKGVDIFHIVVLTGTSPWHLQFSRLHPLSYLVTTYCQGYIGWTRKNQRCPSWSWRRADT